MCALAHAGKTDAARHRANAWRRHQESVVCDTVSDSLCKILAVAGGQAGHADAAVLSHVHVVLHSHVLHLQPRSPQARQAGIKYYTLIRTFPTSGSILVEEGALEEALLVNG